MVVVNKCQPQYIQYNIVKEIFKLVKATTRKCKLHSNQFNFTESRFVSQTNMCINSLLMKVTFVHMCACQNLVSEIVHVKSVLGQSLNDCTQHDCQCFVVGEVEL